MRTWIRSAVCLIGLVCLAAFAHAGVVIQQEGGEVGSNKPKQKMTLYIQSGKLRMDADSPDNKKIAMIFDGDRQVMWMLMPDEGTYIEMTASQVEQMGQQMGQAMQQMGQAMQQMQGQLAQMPPEQRKMVEEMMKKQMGGGGAPAAAPQITVEEKGSGEKIGSFNCTRYAVLSNGQLTQDVWAASTDQVHLQEADYKTFQAMAKFYEPLRRNAPKGSWSAPPMQQIKGMPVRMISYEGQRPSYQWDVLKVDEKSLENSLFTLPAGLKKQGMMPSGMGMGRGLGK